MLCWVSPQPAHGKLLPTHYSERREVRNKGVSKVFYYSAYSKIPAAQRTRFFTGNNAVDAGAAGAALGVATQYFANQIFNPCTRGGTRGGNKNTNNRIFGGQTLANGALGFAAGFAGAALVNSALGNPCGR